MDGPQEPSIYLLTRGIFDNIPRNLDFGSILGEHFKIAANEQDLLEECFYISMGKKPLFINSIVF